MVINSILWSINRYFMIADAALRWLLNRKVKIGIERERGREVERDAHCNLQNDAKKNKKQKKVQQTCARVCKVY